MKKLPTDWCIEATEENFAELHSWWRANADSVFRKFAIGYTLMSSHTDGSCYYGSCIEDCVEAHPNHKPITLEQFRAITNPNPISKHPENWYIPVTADNYADIKPWWLEQVEKSGWKTRHLHDHHLVLSNHPKDNSHYWSGSECQFKTKHPSYEKITLEQFLQITNRMNTLPTKWYIEVTEENQEELDRWRRKVATEYRNHTVRVGFTLLSSYHGDSSHYYTGNTRSIRDSGKYNDYQEITLEQFRQITNPKNINTLPTKWYIQATEENHKELNSWRRKNATEYLDYPFKVGDTLLSKHHTDKSCYYSGDASEVRVHSQYTDYQEITLEQFRQITNQTQKPMKKSIQISRELLNEYYDAATAPQEEYLVEHFKLDGTTTDEAIRGLHDLACKTWKPRIKKNHPECFEDEKYFDFSAISEESIVAPKVAKALGLNEDFIQVRNGSNPKLRHRSFYLSPDYNWELVNDDDGVTPIMVLIPTKK